MNRINLILISCFILKIANSQTIAPALTDEYCPNVEYTFTVTIPKTYQSMIGVGGCFVTQTPTPPVGSTFTFKGKFGDANQKQIFRIIYSDNTSFDFEFKKIKSLFYSTSCAQVFNQSPITVPRCQVVNIPISVSNVQWGTNFESPTLCFGAISDFEYQLPAGWSIGANVSTGSNWIPGGNSVTVTSDISNGVNGVIFVRPRNTCTTGLQNGQTPGQIPISRPAPTLSITGTQDYICSGCTNFTINGIPTGATVQWSLSNTTDASISGCSTCSDVSICRNTSNNTIITLTATVTHCTFSYTVTHDISLGAVKPNDIEVILVDPSIGRIQVAIDPPVPGATSYNWYKNGVLQTNSHGSFAQIPIARNVCNVFYDISCAAINSCGTSVETHKNVNVPPCGNSFVMSPNPATSSITISTSQTKTTSGKNSSFNEVRIFDFQGNLKKYQQYAQVNQTTINISELVNGTYFIEITNGVYKERQQLIIQR